MLRLGASALLLSLAVGCTGSTEAPGSAAGESALTPAGEGAALTAVVLSVPEMH